MNLRTWAEACIFASKMKDGWEGTIGKVVDEERILYAQGLEPAVDTAASGLFSVQLNLENIPSYHRTPDDYRHEKQELDSAYDKEIKALSTVLKEFKDGLEYEAIVRKEIKAIEQQLQLIRQKFDDKRGRTSEHYKDILGRISMEVGGLMKRRSDVDGVILDINRDFVEKNFAGVIRSIELQASASSDKLMQLLMSIQSFTEENAFSIGELNLF